MVSFRVRESSRCAVQRWNARENSHDHMTQALVMRYGIYENGAKHSNPYHPYFNRLIVTFVDSIWREKNARLRRDFNFTLISLGFRAFSKPSKRARNRERRAVKGR